MILMALCGCTRDAETGERINVCPWHKRGGPRAPKGSAS